MQHMPTLSKLWVSKSGMYNSGRHVAMETKFYIVSLVFLCLCKETASLHPFSAYN